MPSFLSDPPLFVYIILLLAVLACFWAWMNRRDRTSLLLFIAALGVLALVFLIDRLFESPREEAVRRVQAMAKAADERDTEGFLANVADTIEYQGDSGQPITISRDSLRQANMWALLKQYRVHVAAWGFSRDDAVAADDNTIEVGFLAKAEADGKQVPMYLRARFHRQADGQFKLTGLSSYDPVKQTNERKTIPNFP